jgi:hypothetical protein
MRPPGPPRAGSGNPQRPRPQTWREMLMPSAQFEDLERRRQTWCDRGNDSNEVTVRDEDEDEDDLQEEPAPHEARIHTATVDMFK